MPVPVFSEPVRVGVLSDTHDLIRPEVFQALRGCALILHAGDVTRREILDRLMAVAPVRAVRGNCDRDWADPLPETLDLDLYGFRVFMAHRKKHLPKDLSPYDLVITGHTHEYRSEEIISPGGRRVLFLDPGSCGPARFSLPCTLAVLTVTAGGLSVTRIDLPRKRDDPSVSGTGDIRRAVDIVMRETEKGIPPERIAEKHGLDPALSERIARLYVTHPGVTADGILQKMGL